MHVRGIEMGGIGLISTNNYILVKIYSNTPPSHTITTRVLLMARLEKKLRWKPVI
jgi:hypothetical protein